MMFNWDNYAVDKAGRNGRQEGLMSGDGIWSSKLTRERLGRQRLNEFSIAFNFNQLVVVPCICLTTGPKCSPERHFIIHLTIVDFYRGLISTQSYPVVAGGFHVVTKSAVCVNATRSMVCFVYYFSATIPTLAFVHVSCRGWQVRSHSPIWMQSSVWALYRPQDVSQLYSFAHSQAHCKATWMRPEADAPLYSRWVFSKRPQRLWKKNTV